MESRMIADRISSSSLVDPIVQISKNLASHQRHLIQLYSSLGYSQPTLLVERKFSELYQVILMTIKDQANEVKEEVEAVTREIQDLNDDIQYLRVYLDDHRLKPWDLEALLDHEVTISRLKQLQKIKRDLLHLKYERESEDIRFSNSGPDINLGYLQKLEKHYIECDQEASEPSSSFSVTQDYDQARFDSELPGHLGSNGISEFTDSGFGHQRIISMPVTHENPTHAQNRILRLKNEALSRSRETPNYYSKDVGCWDSSLQYDRKRDERLSSNLGAIFNYERSSQLRLTYMLNSQEKVKVIRQEWIIKGMGYEKTGSSLSEAEWYKGSNTLKVL
ncbi:uncharacterized protein MELLADRAFT_69069 [Melampsora larici-populina 98AG31]|uniref:Uncharacterized protein n=1 Tax=Melampsora larici-populina (strain 98AG31 / pathotype 3-4-7) TaxID=747676 RepID=F4S9A3_MELLP|nr:uncharacterized protein MELLADRAFT_69069 [Melampsora larici-populina 98AG31]EGF98800.1 hypothetical protein MELLADRAFT_69069 [Melampsora larici-populina 98AG31]